MRTENFQKSLTEEQAAAFNAILYDKRQETIKEIKKSIEFLYSDSDTSYETETGRTLYAIYSLLDAKL